MKTAGEEPGSGPVSAQPNRSATPARQRGIEALVFAWLVLMLFHFPRVPEAGLDASWRMAMGYFFEHGTQFGRDTVFTYGPLGFATARTFAGSGLGWMVGWQLGASLVFSALIVATGRRMLWPLRAMHYFYFGLLGLAAEEALYVAIIALIGGVLLTTARHARLIVAVSLAALLASLSLVKFTNLMLACAVVGVVVIFDLWEQRRSRAGIIAVSYGLGCLAGWVMAGQRLDNLASYLKNSWEIASGYQAAMGVSTNEFLPALAFALLAILAVGLPFAIARSADRPLALSLGTIIGALVFLSWKHGFTRTDLCHTPGFFGILAVLTPSLATVYAGGSERGKKWLGGLLGLVSLGAVVGFPLSALLLPPLSCCAAPSVAEQLSGNLQGLFHPGGKAREFDTSFVQQAGLHALPQTRALAGNLPVDVLGYELSAALFNHLNYRPRPIFQSYSAYTPRLAELNRAFYDSPTAPTFVLQKLETIDHRLPVLDDAPLLQQLVYQYDYRLEENGYLVWQRRTNCPAGAAVAPRFQRAETLRLNQRLEIKPEENLWVAFDLRLSAAGKLLGLVYRPPAIWLGVEFTNGARGKWRIPHTMASSGFLANPLIEDQAAFVAFAQGKPGRRIRALTIEVAPGDEKFFAPELTLKLHSLAPISGVGMIRPGE